MISIFVVVASLAGVFNACLIILAGLTELIAGTISIGISGILVGKSYEERHQTTIRYMTQQIEKDPACILDCFTTFLAADLPAFFILEITTYCRPLPIREKVSLITQSRQDPTPRPRDSYKAAIIFFLTSFSGLPAYIPYFTVRKDQIDLAFYISIGTFSVSSFAYGWIKTGCNVGWMGVGNVARCFWGGFTFLGAFATAALLSVVIIRGIDHNL